MTTTIDFHNETRGWPANHALLVGLCDDTRVMPCFDRAGIAQDWWCAGHQWQRTFSRFDVAAGARVTLLYESLAPYQQICLVEISMRQTTLSEAHQIEIAFDPIGWMVVTRFPFDTALPGLARVVAENQPVKVLRYRPHKRCTLCVAHAPSEYVYAKVFADNRGAILHGENEKLWQTARSGELGFRVAEPLAWVDETNTLFQRAVPGMPIAKRLLAEEGPSLASRMGRALATLHQATLEPSREFGLRDQHLRTRKYAVEITARVPELAQKVEDFAVRLERAQLNLPAGRLVPIHGSPHAGQWLDDGGQLGLVDFDRFSLGHAELDVATFVAEMDFENNSKGARELVSKTFLDAYAEAAMSFDKALFNIYRAHKRFAKAFKVAKATDKWRVEKVMRVLDRADACLD
jgi:aminoglycoside phosphotransferase